MTRQRVPNAELYRDTARQNLLTNGGFEIWQRGNGPFTALGGMAPDRWALEGTGTDTLSVSRDTTNVDSSFGGRTAAACVAVKGTGTVDSLKLTQNLKPGDGYQLPNLMFSLSVRVRTTTANAVRIGLYDGAAFAYSSYHAGGGTWQTLSVTATMIAAPSLLQSAIVFNASCTAYLDNAMLVVGNVAADYAPLHPADDLARCERYYEVPGSDGKGSLIVNGYGPGAGQSGRASFKYRQTKPVTPTVTKVGTWTVGNAGQPNITGSSIDGFVLNTSCLAAGDFYAYNTSTGMYITSEANP